MEIRIMLFILMMMVMPVSYAACYSELSVQHNLVVQGDFALTQTQMATYEHNFNDSSCVSTNTITPMSPSDIIVGLYNDTIKLNLHFEWTNKNNITLSNNQTSFTSGYSVAIIGGLNLFNLNAFETTVTDESPMAAAAKMGLSRIPKKGKRIPAATGIRIVL